MKPEKFICFIHIEKCAGTSLNRMLHNNFLGYFNISSRPKSVINGLYTEKQFLFTKRLFPFIKGMGGHSLKINAGYEKHLNLPIFYFTFLRKAIPRYISHMNYQVHKMNIPWTIEKFLADPQFNNFQTKAIAGSADLEKAKAVLLERFDFVGLVEHFDLSLFILKENLGYPGLNIHYEKVNVAREKDRLRFKNLDDNIKERVTNANRLDIELYDFAEKEIFNKYKLEKYRGQLEKFEQENQKFKYNSFRQFQRKLKNQAAIHLFQPFSILFS